MHVTHINESGLTISFKLRGMVSYYLTIMATEEDLENFHHMMMTSEEEWLPY